MNTRRIKSRREEAIKRGKGEEEERKEEKGSGRGRVCECTQPATRTSMEGLSTATMTNKAYRLVSVSSFHVRTRGTRPA